MIRKFINYLTRQKKNNITQNKIVDNIKKTEKIKFPYLIVVLQIDMDIRKIIKYKNVEDINLNQKYSFISEFIEIKNDLEEKKTMRRLSRIII